MDSQDQLRVALVQRAASLEPAENRAALETLTETAASVDLLVLPEASSRDFGQPGSDLSAYAETLDGPYAQGIRELADPATVVSGMFEAGPGHPYNTLIATGPSGEATYRKIHLYDSFGFKESDQLSAGPLEPVTLEVGGFTLGLMTCYDLRFPELGRALVDAGADVFVVPAAWVAGPLKVDHWRTLLRARAIENTVYVAAAAQPGPRYSGHSMLVAPDGEVLAEAGAEDETVTGVIERDRVAKVRRTNPSLANRRM